MSEQPARIVTCPNCRKRMQYSTSKPDRPFCSERCRLIDFGGWANEEHRIPGNAQEADLMSQELRDGEQ